MPLLIPGLNEADAKTFTKRLLKSLKQRGDTPSLTQLQILVAQAIGHADWHAAQAFWSQPVAPVPIPKAPEEGAFILPDDFDAEEARSLLASFADAMGKIHALMAMAAMGGTSLKNSMAESFSSIRRVMEESGVELPEEKKAWYEASEICFFETDEDDLSRFGKKRFRRLKQFIQQVEQGVRRKAMEPMAHALAQTHRHLFAAHHPLAAIANSPVQLPAPHGRATGLQVFQDAMPKAMAAVTRLKNGPVDSASLKYLLDQVVRLRFIQGWSANPRLEAAARLAQKALTDKIWKNKGAPWEQASTLENHLRRARATMAGFFKQEQVDTFLPADVEIGQGASLQGDWSLLETALSLSPYRFYGTTGVSCADHPALSLLFQWWKENAPEHVPASDRNAGSFLVGVLSGGQVSYLGTQEFRPILPEELVALGSYAVFRSPRGFTYVLDFFQEENPRTRGRHDPHPTVRSLFGLITLKNDVASRRGA